MFRGRAHAFEQAGQRSIYPPKAHACKASAGSSGSIGVPCETQHAPDHITSSIQVECWGPGFDREFRDRIIPYSCIRGNLANQ